MLHVSDPIVSALDQIDRRGDVGPLVTTVTQRAFLTNSLLKRRFVRWNRWRSRYELTQSGRRLLKGYAQAQSRSISRARQGMLGLLTIRIAAATCVAATMALAIVATPNFSVRVTDQSSAATHSIRGGTPGSSDGQQP
jgi:hypothetical protein